eukprot:jgi/Chrzof1/12569/UNPLg00522.t1
MMAYVCSNAAFDSFWSSTLPLYKHYIWRSAALVTPLPRTHNTQCCQVSCSCTAMGAFKARHYINSVRLFD